MAARYVGAEPTSSCTQMGHLVDLLKNRVNSQQNPSLYEVWKPKTAEDVEKQMVRRLFKDGKLPGTCMGTLEVPVLALSWRRAGSAIVTSQLCPFPEQGRQPHTRKDLGA